MEEPHITRMLRILETSGIGALEWDFEQKTLFLCESFLSILNEPKQDRDYDIHFFWKRVHESDRELITSSINSRIQRPAPIDIEFRLKEYYGNYIWVRAQGQITHNTDGEPSKLTAAITNVTRQHGIEEELKVSEKRLRHASECANISLWEITAEYSGVEKIQETVWWSDSLYFILGYDKTELLQTREQIYQIMHPEDAGYVKQKSQEIIDHNSVDIDLEFRLRHKTEGFIWLRCVGHRQRLNEHSYEASGAVININDLKIAQHEAKIKNEKLKQINDELEHFAYTASHDLRAPLRGLKNLANWIREDLKNPPEPIKQHLRLMSTRVARMDNLLSDILTYSRAGRQNKEPEEVNLQQLIGEIWDYIAAPNEFSLRLDLQQNSLLASKTLLEQTFSNLISNAIKHHDKPAGTIHISYRITDDEHQFAITDDGPGIDQKYEHKIFQMFQTLRSRDEVEGSGVGLAIVKRNINSAGGLVWLNAAQTDRGACFHFTLPVDAGTMANERKSLKIFDNAP